MSWLIFGALALISVVLSVMVLKWQPGTRNRSWNEIQRFVRMLMILMENGEVLRVEHVGSEIRFDIARAEDPNGRAFAVLRVPRASWTIGCKGLRESFEAQSFAYTEVDDPTVIGEVRIPVDDIWSEWAGAKGAHAVHVLLTALSVPQSARFNFSLAGRRSKRAVRRYSKSI
jgi:hypothetical protein